MLPGYMLLHVQSVGCHHSLRYYYSALQLVRMQAPSRLERMQVDFHCFRNRLSFDIDN